MAYRDEQNRNSGSRRNGEGRNSAGSKSDAAFDDGGAKELMNEIGKMKDVVPEKYQWVVTGAEQASKQLKGLDPEQAINAVPGFEYDSETKMVNIAGGLLTVSPGVAQVVAGMWKSLEPTLSSAGQGFLYEKFDTWQDALKGRETNILQKLGSNPAYARYAALALPLSIYAIPRLMQIKRDYRSFWNAEADMLNEVSPVLQQLQGSVTTKALRAVGFEQNEMIAGEYQRINNQFQSQNTANVIRGTAGAIPLAIGTVIADAQIRDKVAGKAADIKVAQESKSDAFKTETTQQAKANLERDGWVETEFTTPEEKVAYRNELTKERRRLEDEHKKSGKKTKDKDDTPDSMRSFKTIAGIAGSGAAEVLTQQLIKSQTQHLQPKTAVSAYAMTMQLSKEIARNGAHESSYRMPDGVKDHKSFKLEDYIQHIFMQHQKDMGREEISKARTTQLQTACKHIAEAIREEKMDPLGLVQLVGARAIVMDEGRRVLNEGAAKHQIEDACNQFPARYDVTNIEEYKKELEVPAEQVAVMVADLPEGDKQMVTSLLPASLLTEPAFGMKVADVVQLQANITPQARYEWMGKYAQAAMELGKEAFESMDMPPEYIKAMENIAKAHEKNGAEGVKKFCTEFGNHELIGGAPQLMINVMADQAMHAGKVAPAPQVETAIQ